MKNLNQELHIKKITLDIDDGRVIAFEGKFTMMLDTPNGWSVLPFKNIFLSPIDEAMSVTVSDEIIKKSRKH